MRTVDRTLLLVCACKGTFLHHLSAWYILYQVFSSPPGVATWPFSFQHFLPQVFPSPCTYMSAHAVCTGICI